MNLLLDSVTFYRLTMAPDLLSASALSICQDPNNTLLLSSVSIAEMMIKHRSGKLKLPGDPRLFVHQERIRYCIKSLALDEESALLIETLPPFHKDPFDRLLICQALTHDITIVTPDMLIQKYTVPTIW